MRFSLIIRLRWGVSDVFSATYICDKIGVLFRVEDTKVMD